MKYSIAINVRKRGTIGIFYRQFFIVEGPEGLDVDFDGLPKIFDLWQKAYGTDWEPQGLNSVGRIIPQQ